MLKNPSIRIDARGAEAKFDATPLTDDNAVKSVVEKFREKYGAADVKKYYSKFDVAVVVDVDCLELNSVFCVYHSDHSPEDMQCT